jgi:hypothetical protein
MEVGDQVAMKSGDQEDMQSRSFISFHLNVLNVSYSYFFGALIILEVGQFRIHRCNWIARYRRKIRSGKIETQESGILS